jgi:menaquinone-dependent protoporphyrinogen oxidase
MKVLVAFGTTEGQTQKIAKHVAEKVLESGHEVELYDCSRRLRGHEFGTIDATIVAASVHQKDHQESVVAFATAHQKELDAKPSAFISVSLSAAFEDGKKDASGYAERFVEATGWQPAFTHLAAGALKYSEYDFFKEQIIRHIVMAGRQIPPDQKDGEFTDWAALDSFIAEFLQSASATQ